MVSSGCKISIIIRSYNEQEGIERLFRGIFEQTVRNAEIILVDSGSTDATLSIAAQFPVTILHISPEDFSFGRSLNLGCEAATGEYIVIASAHVYPVYRNWLEQMLMPFTDAKTALVYGKQRGNNVTKFSERQIFAQWFGEKSNFRQSHPFCNNANAAIRRSVWARMPYDETLTGLEDLSWALKISELGYRIAYNADAEVCHAHDETWGRVYQRYRREAISMKRIFPGEYFNIWDFLRLFGGNVASDYYHAWHDRLLRRNILSIFLFRFMQFCGTYRGFCQHGPVSKELRQKFYYPKELARKTKSANTQVSDDNSIDYSKVWDRINL